MPCSARCRNSGAITRSWRCARTNPTRSWAFGANVLWSSGSGTVSSSSRRRSRRSCATRAKSRSCATGRSSCCAPDGVRHPRHRRLAAPATLDHVDWDEDRMEKEGFETFMLKEIHEQGDRGRGHSRVLGRGHRASADESLTDQRLREVSRIVIVACGTSYHAGLAGQLAIERWARIPVEVDVASEFRYQDPIVSAGTLVLGITQSGRDCRHARSDAPRTRTGRDGRRSDERRRQPSHAGRRRGPVHARRNRDGSRRDEDVRRAGRAAVRARAAPCERSLRRSRLRG